MKNQKLISNQSDSKSLRAALYSYYAVPTLQDYADLMYQRKSEGNNKDVAFMASLLNKDEAKFVLEYLVSFLFNLGMDHHLTTETIAHDFRLEQHEEEFEHNHPDDFDPELDEF